MKTEEKDYLKEIKHSDGLSYKEADEEIGEFIHTQRQFKILNRELKKKDTAIRNLEIKLVKKDETILKLRQTKQPKQKKQKETPVIKSKQTDDSKEMFLKEMTKQQQKKLETWKKYKRRIELNMEPGQDYTKLEFSTYFQAPYYTVNWCITNLLKEGKIQEVNCGRHMRYRKI